METQSTPEPENTKKPLSEIEVMFNQLQAADNTLAQLALALKDADKRQEIGAKLVAALDASINDGLAFSAIKMTAKAGVLSITFKMPTAQLRLESVA